MCSGKNEEIKTHNSIKFTLLKSYNLESCGIYIIHLGYYNLYHFNRVQAGKEWRVVTQFLEKLCTADRNEMPVGPLADCESLTEIDYSMFNVKKTGFIPIGL